MKNKEKTIFLVLLFGYVICYLGLLYCGNKINEINDTLQVRYSLLQNKQNNLSVNQSTLIDKISLYSILSNNGFGIDWTLDFKDFYESSDSKNKIVGSKDFQNELLQFYIRRGEGYLESAKDQVDEIDKLSSKSESYSFGATALTIIIFILSFFVIPPINKRLENWVKN